jgi:hypothetical protein
MNNKGILYIATGEEFVKEAEVSARSVSNVMPNIPIAIATEADPSFDFDYIINVSDPHYGFQDKISNMSRSPFERTLFLDTDIYMGSDVSELFELLNEFDVGLAYNHNREAHEPIEVPDSFPEYNTGVIVYRNDENFRRFTETWKENHDVILSKTKTHDQPSFRKTLFDSDLRIATLTPEYNCMVRYLGHVRNEVKIAHSRLLDIDTPGADKSVSVPDALEKLNRYEGHRLYEPNGSRGVSIVRVRVPMDAPLYKKAINSLWLDGLTHTVRSGIPFLLRRLQAKDD